MDQSNELDYLRLQLLYERARNERLEALIKFERDRLNYLRSHTNTGELDYLRLQLLYERARNERLDNYPVRR